MIAESWTERERPSSILDTGYSGTNVFTPRDAERAGLPNLGPLNRLISDANDGISQAAGQTRVQRKGLPPEASDGLIAPQIQHSLTGGTAFANQGLIMIFHPHYEGVTIHRREDVDITCTGDPVVTGYREQTGKGFWRVPIESEGEQVDIATAQEAVSCGEVLTFKVFSNNIARRRIAGNGDCPQCL